MITRIYQFIREKFDVMPEWVQISTYIFFILCFAALLFSPRFIDIRLVSTLEGGEFPIGGAIVEIETEDRIISMVTNGKGRFSVPISFANPLKEFTFVLYPEPNTRRQNDIQVSGHKAYSPWNKLIYSRENDEYKFSAIFDYSVVATAYAQDRVSQFKSMDKVDDVVIDAISKITGLNADDITIESKLSEELSLSNYDLSYVNHRLGEEFGIEAWKEIWQVAQSVEDIVGIARALFYQDKPWGEHLISRNKNVNRLLAEAKDKYPKAIYNKFLTARALRKSGNSEKSLELLEQVLSEHPDFYLAKYNQALANDSLSNSKSTKITFEEAIKLQVQLGFRDASLYNTYGRFLFRNEMYKESLEAFMKVKEIDPDRAFSKEYISDSLKKLGCKNIEQCITTPSHSLLNKMK